MKSGLAVDERVAISRGTCSPYASPARRRRTAGPFLSTQGLARVHEDARLLFTLPTWLEGAGGGGSRRRTCIGPELEPSDSVASPN